jgi:adenylate cyclase
MPLSRQLAAIMFTDIAGYTALMGEDERKAIDLLNTNRHIQKPIIEQFDGKWIKEIGDGVLASFSTVTNAVMCASAIQASCRDFPDLHLRIGIHLGEVIFENGDVFGDGVNIAARLQAIAPIGGVWVSESVYNNLTNKKGIESRFIRQEVLKNVKDPVNIYEIIINGLFTDNHQAPYKTLPAQINNQKSIAVLPFVNMSTDPEQEYFSDGIAEEILNSLSHLKDLKVAGRSSSFQFKGKNDDLRTVGEKLGVSTVLEGSVRKQGNRLRVTAQLINVKDGFNLWSERYDRNMDDIFAIQEDIALAITEKLKITLLGKERDIIGKVHTLNPDAYELYLKGRFNLNRRGSSLIPALHYLQQAIDIDPEFALAYAEYANVCLLLGYYSQKAPVEVMPMAKKAADEAIRLDSTLCEPYTSLGYYYSGYEFNGKEGKKNFEKSIELNPRYALGHYWFALFYYSFLEGKFEDAERHAKIAVDLEPFSAITQSGYALVLYCARKYEEAIQVAKISIEQDANTFLSHFTMGHSYLEIRRFEDAEDAFKFAMKISNRHQWAVHGLLWTFCLCNHFEEARLLMDEMKDRLKKEYLGLTFMGLSAGLLGELDLAITYLEEAFTTDPTFVTLKYLPWPIAPALRSHPAYVKLLNKIWEN